MGRKQAARCSCKCTHFLLQVLADGVGAAQLAALKPDFGAMAAAGAGGQVQGVIVCAREGETQQQQQQQQGQGEVG